MFRWSVIVVLTVVLMPLSFIVFQSLLNTPFFDANRAFGIGAFQFIFDDPDFWLALKNSLTIAGGMLFIAIPLGAVLRVPDGPHRLAGPSLDRTDAAHASLYISDGAGLRLRRLRGSGRLLLGVVEVVVRRRRSALVHLHNVRNHADRRPDPCAACVLVFICSLTQSRLRC